MAYQEDRSWSDQYHKQVRAVIGFFNTEVADKYTDCQLATDYRVNGRDVACRLRRSQYASKYPDQFTLRAARDSGQETELSKVLKGKSDWMLYGFVQNGKLADWKIIDLAVFRQTLNSDYGVLVDCEVKHNNDGTHFNAYKESSFPKNLIVAKGNGLDFLN
jgi:hypothetical protein